MWKAIQKGWDVFSAHIRFKLRDGRCIRFWEDLWCGEQPLSCAFPSLFSIAVDKHAYVVDCYRLDSSEIIWDVLFRRSFQDWEMDEVCAFLDLLYRQEGVGGGNDVLLWAPSSHGRFEVRSLFLCLSNFANRDFLWKTIWRSMAPTRVAFFVWTAVWGKILTIDNLRRRGNCTVNRCCLYKDDEESVDHLLLHCPVANDCWNLIIGLFGMCWVMPRSTKELIHVWRGYRVRRDVREFWRIVPHCVWWCIWKERNNRMFEGNETPTAVVKLYILRSLFNYVKRSFCSSSDDLITFLYSLGP
ncbi:uncharacterized protein LOC132303802 [Cornus florida]|uniref:uncharacterized protein LOC132303802 n=1 Tax=Cornus florida TaxID=4283 RepID=UPI002899781F|nr:uncharacterized protein LOC132303802 [Cornus florida]